jgi:signal transduction histidine kinase
MRIGTRWKDVSIAKKLYFVVGVMALLIMGELITLQFAMRNLSAARAFVAGEGIWSKSQKNALIYLQRFGRTKDPQEYQNFLDQLKIPESDHQARLEMMKANPDMTAIRSYFLGGEINAADIDPMVHLIIRFHRISYLARAIQQWSRGDELLTEFKQAAENYHQAILRNDEKALAVYRPQIRKINDEVSDVETEFSKALGDGSRWLEYMVLTLLSIAVLIVESIGLSLTFLTSRSLSRGLHAVNDAALKIGHGDFRAQVIPQSKDEIGQLARSVNKMGNLLQESYAEFEAQSRNQLDIILGGITDGILVTDTNDKIIFANDMTAKLFGFRSLAELLQTPASRLFDAIEIRDEQGAHFSEANLPSSLALAGQEKPAEVLLCLVDQSTQQKKWCIYKSSPVLDHKQRAKLAVTILKDFTEYKRSEDEVKFLDEANLVLNDSLDYHETLREVSALTVSQFGGHCTIEVHEVGDVVKEEAHFSTREIFIPLRSRGHVLGSMKLVLDAKKENFSSQERVLAEELARRVGSAVDNALLYKEAQKAIEIREEFLSIASHELKTPITSLSLQLEMTRKGINLEENVIPAPEKMAKMLDNSRLQVTRLIHLVEDLLDATRIQTGKFSFNFEEINFSDLVTEMNSRFTEQFSRLESTVKMDIEPNVIGFFDHARLEQVIDNLLSNALKYAPASLVRISLKKTEEQVQLVIADHGPGIPLENQARVFERFERATSHRNVSGLGLGLFIVKEIIEGHGGTIRLESEPNQGTRFLIDLPLRKTVTAS